MIILKIFVIYYIIVACLGRYAGYVRDHGLRNFLYKQREFIKKRGKLITFLYRNYKAYYKNNDKYVYTKCLNYAKKFKQEDINYAITHLKADIKVFDAIGLLVTVCAGLSSPIINSYVEYFISSFDVENKEAVGNLFGLFYILFLVLFIRKITPLMHKQTFLLNILEDAKEYINDKDGKEHFS